MRILIDMGHPAHVHLFKNFILEMENRGHEIKVTARDKEVTKYLLDAYRIPYELIGTPLSGKFPLFREWVMRTYGIVKIGRKFDADIYIGVLNPAAAFSAWFNRKVSLTFSDTEHAKFAKSVTFPFTDIILTPSCYNGEIGKKQICYAGYHEIAYLHPNYFTPNPAVLTEIGLTESDLFIIVRFISWNASHDVGQHGICDKVGLVKELEKYGRVLITSEGALPQELNAYQIHVSPEKLHDLLYYATLYVGDGGTTASEAAVLGTPAVFISTSYCGYQCDEEKYGLLYLFPDPVSGVSEGLKKIRDLLNDPHLKERSRANQLKLIKDKIDVTQFMIWFIENYPISYLQIKADPTKHYH
jgi:uncharacterized protein